MDVTITRRVNRELVAVMSVRIGRRASSVNRVNQVAMEMRPQGRGAGAATATTTAMRRAVFVMRLLENVSAKTILKVKTVNDANLNFMAIPDTVVDVIISVNHGAC